MGRVRPDASLDRTTRMMNDRLAKDMYDQVHQSAVRDNRDVNDSEDEEEFQGYVKPVVDEEMVAIKDSETRIAETAIDTERKEAIAALRANKAHQALPPLDRLGLELEVWTGQRSVNSVVSKVGGSKFYKSASHRSSAANDDETALSSQVDAADAAGRLLTTPSYLRGTLREYQIEGVNWMLNLHSRMCSGILADEMGLGKTFQTIALLAYMKYTLHLKGPHLVVVPKSVLGNWYREFKRWCPTISVIKFHGDREARDKLCEVFLRREPYRFDVYLTTYDTVLAERNAFKRPPWHYLIVDEAHKLKNAEGSTYGALSQLRSRHRLLITGTPLQNDMKELWALLSFLSPYLFNDSSVFTRGFDPASASPADVAKMHSIMGAAMLRRLKSEVKTSIPPKREIYVSCGIAAKQREWYLKVLAREAGSINRSTGNREALMNIIMQLRKAANHPYLFPEADETGGFETDERIVTSAGKMVILDKLLARLKSDEAAKHKVLIFSQMTRMLDILEDYLNLRGYKYFRIDGSTGGMDRDMQMAEFNNPMSDVFIFLLSTRAGGLGINLQAANNVVIYDSDWNPQMDLQAQDRAHRIGQTREVRIYRFITDQTVDERVYQRALKKLYLDALIVQSGRAAAQRGKDAASRDELMAMVRFGANEMFKSKSSEVTDADIDALLASGESRMQALQREIIKVQTQTIANFDLGVRETNTYEFEGLTYGNEKSKQVVAEFEEPTAESVVTDLFSAYGKVTKVVLHPECKLAIVSFADLAGAVQAVDKAPVKCHYRGKDTEQLLITAEMIDEHWGDGGGRSKRKITEVTDTLEEEMARAAAARKVPAPKYPRKPTFQFWWLANEKRLVELYELECAGITREWRRKYDSAKLVGTAAEEQKDAADEQAPSGLSPAQIVERDTLLSRSFSSWSHHDFVLFVRAMTRDGVPKTDYAGIARAMGGVKTEEEVERYSRAFWELGPSRIPHFANYEKNIGVFAARREKIKQEAAILLSKIESCSGDPLDNLKFPVKPLPSCDAAFDRVLYMAAVRNGTGALRNVIGARPEYAFDAFLLSRPQEFFESRARRLMQTVLAEARGDQASPGKRGRKQAAEDEDEADELDAGRDSPKQPSAEPVNDGAA